MLFFSSRLAQYQKVNKEAGNEWFTIESNKTGTRWTGKVWYVHDLLRYEFDLEFELPVSYPDVAPELALPELDGKTEKMYRGGKICLDSHFRPLWARNVPHFGIAHAMALGVSSALRARKRAHEKAATHARAAVRAPVAVLLRPSHSARMCLDPWGSGCTSSAAALNRQLASRAHLLTVHLASLALSLPLSLLSLSSLSRSSSLSLLSLSPQMGPWLAVEIPSLIANGRVKHQDAKQE